MFRSKDIHLLTRLSEQRMNKKLKTFPRRKDIHSQHTKEINNDDRIQYDDVRQGNKFDE